MQFLTLGAAAAAVYYFLFRKKGYGFESVRGSVTGKPWMTRVVSITGSGDDKLTTVELWAPKASWGPHDDMLVATYRQKGSDKGSRQSIAIGPHALPQMVTAAGQDFGIQKAAATVSGSAADAVYPLYAPGTRRKIGRVETYHDGNRYQWIAEFNNGRPIASGKSYSIAQAQRNATESAMRQVLAAKRKLAIVRAAN